LFNYTKAESLKPVGLHVSETGDTKHIMKCTVHPSL